MDTRIFPAAETPEQVVRYFGLHPQQECLHVDHPSFVPLHTVDNVDIKQLSLKAQAEICYYHTGTEVVLCWLQGHGRFHAMTETYAMHPGAVLIIPTNTYYCMEAEDDCRMVFLEIHKPDN